MIKKLSDLTFSVDLIIFEVNNQQIINHYILVKFRTPFPQGLKVDLVAILSQAVGASLFSRLASYLLLISTTSAFSTKHGATEGSALFLLILL